MCCDLSTGDVVVVANVGAPCMCCDAYSRPLQFDLDDNVLAWNYDRDGSSRFGGAPYAYAVVTRDDGC